MCNMNIGIIFRQKLSRLIEQKINIERNIHNDSEAQQRKRKEYLDQVNQTFWIGIKVEDLKHSIKTNRILSQADKDKEILFIDDQLGARKFRIGGISRKYARSLKRKEKQLNNIKKLEQENATHSDTTMTSASSASEEESEDSDYSGLDEKAMKPPAPKTVLPKDILFKTAHTAFGEGISPHQHTSIISSVIEAAGGEIENFNCSLSTSVNAQGKIIQKSAEEIRDRIKELSANTTFPVGAQFDAKIVKEVTDGKVLVKDRLAILIRIDGVTELLGIPGLNSGKSLPQTEAIKLLLEEFNLLSKIRYLVFDTTVGNTGVHSGVCTNLVKLIDHTVLHLACRRHVLERHITHHWKQFPSSKTTGPDNPMFKMFKKQWNQIQVDNDVFKQIKVKPGSWLDEQKEQSLRFAKEIIQLNTMNKNGQSKRADYKELAELVYMVLCNDRADRFPLRRPGALHNARNIFIEFMAKAIYFLKMFLLLDSITGLDAEQKQEITEMAEFISIFYAEWFEKSELPSAAPAQDIKGVWQMKRYGEVRDTKCILESIGRHTWYMDPPTVIFALVDEEYTYRGEMAKALYDLPYPNTFTLERQVVDKEVLWNMDYSGKEPPSLVPLITSQSWLTFEILGQDKSKCQWMKLPPLFWSTSDNYLEFEQFVRSIVVVNDSSERAVKLVQEMIDRAHIEEKRQDGILYVNNYKRKGTGRKKSDYYSLAKKGKN